MAGLDSGATGIDRTSADTRALRVFGLGADEASASPETAEGSGAAAASASAEGASLAAGALGGVSLVAGLRRRRRPLPERAASAGAWPLSVWAGAASGGRATEEGAPGSVAVASAGAPAAVSLVARSPLPGTLAAAGAGPASASLSAGSAERPRADAAATAAGPDIRFPLPFPPLPFPPLPPFPSPP